MTNVHLAPSNLPKVTEKLALQLAPRGQLVVFYINSLGELVADGLKLEVEDYFANKVCCGEPIGVEVVLR